MFRALEVKAREGSGSGFRTGQRAKSTCRISRGGEYSGPGTTAESLRGSTLRPMVRSRGTTRSRSVLTPATST